MQARTKVVRSSPATNQTACMFNDVWKGDSIGMERDKHTFSIVMTFSMGHHTLYNAVNLT